MLCQMQCETNAMRTRYRKIGGVIGTIIGTKSLVFRNAFQMQMHRDMILNINLQCRAHLCKSLVIFNF